MPLIKDDLKNLTLKNRQKLACDRLLWESVPFSYCLGKEGKSKILLVSFRYHKKVNHGFLVFSFLYLESNGPPISHLGNLSTSCT